MPTVHGFNGGTFEDQVKICMFNLANEQGKIEVTVKEILEHWNKHKHGKPHTRPQVHAALQSLKHKGHVQTIEITGKGTGRVAKYALTKVLEKLTDPNVPVEEKENADVPVEIVRDSPKETLGLVLAKIAEFSRINKEHSARVVTSYEDISEVFKNQRDSYNILVSKLDETMQKYQEVYDGSQAAHNERSEIFDKFADDFRQAMSEMKQTLVSILTLMGQPGNETDSWKGAYKEGFKDGYEFFRNNN